MLFDRIPCDVSHKGDILYTTLDKKLVKRNKIEDIREFVVGDRGVAYLCGKYDEEKDGYDNTIVIFDINTNQYKRYQIDKVDVFNIIMLSPDNKTIYVSDEDSYYLYNLDTGKLIEIKDIYLTNFIDDRYCYGSEELEIIVFDYVDMKIVSTYEYFDTYNLKSQYYGILFFRAPKGIVMIQYPKEPVVVPITTYNHITIVKLLVDRKVIKALEIAFTHSKIYYDCNNGEKVNGIVLEDNYRRLTYCDKEGVYKKLDNVLYNRVNKNIKTLISKFIC